MAKQSTSKRLIAALGSSWFFRAVLVLFGLQAAWIALSGLYPMAFDENYHLGIIRLYSDHLSPFWSAQPLHADTFGAVFRDPSYLYQWLMSFPYRFISALTDSLFVQVVFLRVINIGLFAAGLVLYRRLLLKTGASRAIVNTVLLVFTLIPVVPLLAAQINYDNLFFLMIGGLLLMTVRYDEELARHKRINSTLGTGIVILCLFGSLVKYAFLPIFAAVICYMVVRLHRTFGSFRGIWRAKLGGLSRVGRLTGVLLVAGLVLGTGLFAERYGVNTVRYHTPIPDCAQVLSVRECSAYGPWIRDHNNELRKSVTATSSPFTFAADWFYGMWFRLIFSVDGPTTGFQTRGPLYLPAWSTALFAFSGIILSVIYAGRLFRRYKAPVLALFLAVSSVYLAALWLDGYKTFLRTGIAVEINGRYLLPVLPFLMLFAALAFNQAFKRREGLKLAVGGLAVVCMLWGGGALTYVLRSNDRWYWPNAPLSRVNNTIRNDIGPLVPGYQDPLAFMKRPSLF
jgi:hypothetical protein